MKKIIKRCYFYNKLSYKISNLAKIEKIILLRTNTTLTHICMKENE